MITLITGNTHKFQEIKAILGESISMVDIDLPEIQSLDVKEVVLEKLKLAREHVQHGAIMVDDTGYYFKSMGRLPGVFSKFFLQELGHEGVSSLVSKLDSNRATTYTCIGYMNEINVVKYFIAHVEGIIVTPSGSNGFGFDSGKG